MTASLTTAAPLAAPPTVAGRTTFARTVRSEWTKFRSLRSSWWTGRMMVLGRASAYSRLVSLPAGMIRRSVC